MPHRQGLYISVAIDHVNFNSFLLSRKFIWEKFDEKTKTYQF